VQVELKMGPIDSGQGLLALAPPKVESRKAKVENDARRFARVPEGIGIREEKKSEEIRRIPRARRSGMNRRLVLCLAGRGFAPPKAPRGLVDSRAVDGSGGGSAPLTRNPKPETFQRDAESVDDEVWRDLVQVMGMREMVSNGAMWERRLRTDRGRLAEALSDYRAKTPGEREGVKNAAAWVTWRFENQPTGGESA
jgi:hypothetical protein